MRRHRSLLALLLLLVAVLAPAARGACAQVPAAAAHHGHHGSGGSHDAPTPSPTHDLGAAHCPVLAACGAVTAEVAVLVPAPTVAVARAVPHARFTLPSSPRAAPEPPPPRG